MKPTKHAEKKQFTKEELAIVQQLLDSGKLSVDEDDTSGLEEIYDEKTLEKTDFLTDEQLQKLKVELKDLFLNDQQKVLDKLKKAVRTNTDKYDDVLLLMTRLKRFKTQSAKGIIPYDSSEREYRAISAAILMAINTLEPEHLK